MGGDAGLAAGTIAVMAGLRILTLAPRVHEHRGLLRARSSLLLQILSLGCFRREVLVDRRARYVTITRRILWLFRSSRVIPFRHVHRIDYDFARTVTSIKRTGVDRSAVSGDEIESFHVALVLRQREDVPESHRHLYEERVPLFSFYGEGRGDYQALWALISHGLRANPLDLEGSQESLSRAYVERLRDYIGVDFGLELPELTDASGQRWACQRCRRPGPPRAGNCYYCGGPLAAVDEAGA